MILSKRKRNAAIRENNRFFLNDDNSDKLAADIKKRKIIKNKNNIIFITDEKISIPEDSELDSNNLKLKTINSRQ